MDNTKPASLSNTLQISSLFNHITDKTKLELFEKVASVLSAEFNKQPEKEQLIFVSNILNNSLKFDSDGNHLIHDQIMFKFAILLLKRLAEHK